MKVMFLILALALSSQAPAQQVSYQHAAQLYQSVISGQRSMDSLSSQERQQVLLIARAVRSSCSSNSHKCQAVCDAANELESAARDLSQCAANHDYSDDCSTYFINTQSAHSDYEDAVSEADGDCD